MTNPYRNINELREWLKENSSGDYRPAAHAATVIGEQESELTTLRAENSELRAKLAAMESQKPFALVRRSPKEDASPMGGDGTPDWFAYSPLPYNCELARMAEKNAFFETMPLYAKPVPAGKPARITKQDAWEIIEDYVVFCGAKRLKPQSAVAIGMYLRKESSALLNELNADREQAPAVALPDYAKIVRELAQEFREAWPDDNGKYAWLIGYSDELKSGAPHSQQSDNEDKSDAN